MRMTLTQQQYHNLMYLINYTNNDKDTSISKINQIISITSSSSDHGKGIFSEVIILLISIFLKAET